MSREYKEAKVKIPATSANLGAGFDTLGLALNLYNYVTISWSESSHMKVEIKGYGRELMQNEGENIDGNMVYQAARKVLAYCGYSQDNLHITLVNNIPFCRGLGSSAAAIVGGAVAANNLIGEPLDKVQLLDLVFDIEGHPDNIYPAMFGGLIVSSNCNEKGENNNYRFKQVELSSNLRFLAVVPEHNLDTKKARQALPSKVMHTDAVFNISRAALLVLAFQDADFGLLHHAMNDRIHEPYRANLMPGLPEILMEIRAKGIPSAISGAGPTILTVLPEQQWKEYQVEIENIFKKHQIKHEAMVLMPENQGAKVITTHNNRDTA